MTIGVPAVECVVEQVEHDHGGNSHHEHHGPHGLAEGADAEKVREEGAIVTVQPLKKNAKFQIETLEKNGYTSIKKIYDDTEL